MTMEDMEALVEVHYDRIVRLAQVMSGNAQDAQDLAQETFLAAIEGVGRFRGESAVGTWLIGILRRRFFKHLRRRRPAALTDEVAVAAPEEPASPAPPDLASAIAQLPEHLRLTLVMFHYEDMDYAAIAEALACPIGTVRSRLHEARARLRTHLAPIAEDAQP